MSGKDSVRHKIIEAAKKRFSHFGYGKTTMADVASDCAMSPGNLYRFFPGKLDIAEAIVTEEYGRHLANMRKLALAPGRSGPKRLHDFMFEDLRRRYHKMENDPRGYEMVLVVVAERPKLAEWIRASERRVLVELLEDGERHGEFPASDNAHVAEMIQSATMKFRYPQLWSELGLPALERELKGVLDLLLNGVCPRSGARTEGHMA